MVPNDIDIEMHQQHNCYDHDALQKMSLMMMEEEHSQYYRVIMHMLMMLLTILQMVETMVMAMAMVMALVIRSLDDCAALPILMLRRMIMVGLLS
jgi:hypothetical protein